MLHRFSADISGIALPDRFTWPFHYVPHTLCRLATQQVQEYISSRTDWAQELALGKMFGVLVVKTEKNTIGFLAAFSGNLAGSNNHEYFVPPVYDMLRPNDFFRQEEAAISDINRRLKDLEQSAEYCDKREDIERLHDEHRHIGSEELPRLKAQKLQMQEIKAEYADKEQWQAKMVEINATTQRLKTRQKQLATEIALAQQALDAELEPLRQERRSRSASLQQRLFAEFRMLNAKGEERDLCELFESTPQHTPPAGAGECAAPKLLQYAYKNNLHPLCMAEFWWGASPKGEVRQHGNFYPSCNSKCKPILLFMMQGLDVDPNPLEAISPPEPKILWEDDYMVIINKPEGMLSVDGKSGVKSVEEWAQQRYPQASGPIIVHRLDQSTSGILVLAKDKATHKALQEQFIARSVEKQYIALLDGTISTTIGTISLPLKLDYENRPRQMVAADGRSAVTRYEVLGTKNGLTRIAFYPLTGRTHQLRVHAAHQDGLNSPMVRDDIYGYGGSRLHLHASRLMFTHPATSQRITIECPPEF